MSLRKRLYEDYFKKDRLPLYKGILECAFQHHYRMVGIWDFYNMISSRDFSVDDSTRIIINRHDIDTSPNIARRMFEIEKGIYGGNGSATYYFRFSTIDKELIREIDEYGYETGYHYETLADYEKKHKFKDAGKLSERMSDIRTVFLHDLSKYRSITNSLSNTVASHGDFINTKLNIQNYEILRDKATRDKSSIIVEAYDDIINEYVNERFADQVLLERFPDEVCHSIESNTRIIMMLSHPRNWTVDIVANTRENIVRLWQGLRYKL